MPGDRIVRVGSRKSEVSVILPLPGFHHVGPYVEADEAILTDVNVDQCYAVTWYLLFTDNTYSWRNTTVDSCGYFVDFFGFVFVY